MAQVKIYGLRSRLVSRRAALSDAIHQALMESLKLPKEKRFQRFILLETDDFIYPPDRSENYTIIEISLFEGRSTEAKKSLIHTLFSLLSAKPGIDPQDLEITLFETPQANWGIRGKPADELTLSYQVEL